MSLIPQGMPEKSGVSKLLWTVGRPVEGEKEEEAHSGIAGNSLRKACVSKLDKSGVPYFDLCWIKYRKLCNES